MEYKGRERIWENIISRVRSWRRGRMGRGVPRGREERRRVKVWLMREGRGEIWVLEKT